MTYHRRTDLIAWVQSAAFAHTILASNEVNDGARTEGMQDSRYADHQNRVIVTSAFHSGVSISIMVVNCTASQASLTTVSSSVPVLLADQMESL